MFQQIPCQKAVSSFDKGTEGKAKQQITTQPTSDKQETLERIVNNLCLVTLYTVITNPSHLQTG